MYRAVLRARAATTNRHHTSEGLVPGTEWFERITACGPVDENVYCVPWPWPGSGLQSETISQEVAVCRTANYRIEATVRSNVVKP